jgi:aspartyl-tRNA(Asn)/glutamyl-tRNA(Gln) amidotransferase subunit C
MLTEKEVQHIAKLAKLPLTKEEAVLFSHQLSEVINYINILSEVNTDTVAPTFQVTGQKSAINSTQSLTCTTLPLEKVLRNAPRTEGNQFLVPPVFTNA